MDADILKVEELSRRFGPLVAVDRVSFSVRRGEIFGFLGPNGAGKSTTIAMLATLLPPTGGRALLDGHDVVRERVAVRRRIGIVFQDGSLDDRLTAEENLYFHALLYQVPMEEFSRRSQALLEMVGLADRRHHAVRTFSGGMRRRLEIARGLLHRPALLFLDEPTVGLDPQTRAAIWAYVRGLRDEHGVTVFLTTHYLDEAENCDRIAILDHGRIQALGSPEELKSSLGGDVIDLTSPDAEGLLRRIQERLPVEGRTARREGSRVRLTVADGAHFIPRLLQEVGGGVDSVSLRRPTLDDVFLSLTGREIREEEASERESMRRWRRRWRG